MRLRDIILFFQFYTVGYVYARLVWGFKLDSFLPYS